MASQRALAADFGECGRERLPELDVRGDCFDPWGGHSAQAI